MNAKKIPQHISLMAILIALDLTTACASDDTSLAYSNFAQNYTNNAQIAECSNSAQNYTNNAQITDQQTPLAHAKGSRDNTPKCLSPAAPGTTVYSNEYFYMDASNTSDGYIVAKYTGSSSKIKLQITGPDQNTYTYNLSPEPKEEVFNLQSGNGTYLVCVYENIAGTQYSQAFGQEISVKLNNEFLPFLYPNQYVNFKNTNQAITKASELAYLCNSDLEVVSEVYNYVIKNIAYDYEKAKTVQSGYLPDIDNTLATNKGICLDYAALMTAMLRSQNIPTRMEVGYAGTAYHAWLSTYIQDIGWVNGMIEFDGHDWSLMDPTFAANTKKSQLKSFIGDGSNYITKYIY